MVRRAIERSYVLDGNMVATTPGAEYRIPSGIGLVRWSE